ncbi:hypothetical protein EBT16_02485 [bacterium]|nr:hypothetical protein [bacterium]
MNHQRLLEVFTAKLDKVCPSKDERKARNDAWWSLMDKHGCRMIPSGQIADLVNNGPGDYVCMKSFNVSVVDAHWVLVPKDLAEKALVLGYVP